MTDDGVDGSGEPTQDTSGPNWGMIAVIVVVIAIAVGGAVLLFGNDDDADTESSTTAAAETSAPAAATTEAPETTSPTTEEPATTAAPATTESAPVLLEYSIGDIEDGGTIPVAFTCDGENAPPIVTITNVPEGVLQLAMVVDDPDAPTVDPFVHWLVYNIPGNSSGFSDEDSELAYGVNDAGLDGWFGPCPPQGDGPHEYAFVVYGLNQQLELAPGLDGRALAEAIEPSVVAQGIITASYERAAS
jgi:Raf kinase inhibitor-like YbhB/YbcL family protein